MLPVRLFFFRYTHKTSSYLTSSYKTSSYKMSIYQTPSYRMSRLQNVQVTKRPFYKRSRLQNVQDTKRPVFVNLKTCLIKPFFTKYLRNFILYAADALRPTRAKLWFNPTLRSRHHALCGPCLMGSMGDAVHGCVTILYWDRSGSVAGTQWAGCRGSCFIDPCIETAWMDRIY